eukprot:4814457-Pyramimonas_sp.AAC.1
MQNEYNIQVSDTSPYQVRVGGQLALAVKVDGVINERIWEEDWKHWEDLHNNAKFLELLNKCDTILQRSSVGMKGGAKGTSKGQSGK